MTRSIDECLREVCAILNEGFATLETMNEARAALDRLLSEAVGEGPDTVPADLRRAAEETRDLLRTEDAELTPGGVARRLADAQARLRHALSEFCEGTAVSGG